MNYYDLILQLKNNSSINKKKEIMEQCSEDNNFKFILKLAYDPLVIWNIKKIPDPEKYGTKDFITVLKDVYKKVILEQLRGNELRKFIKSSLEQLSTPNQELLKLILKKDLKCGINIKLINSVFPGLIYQPLYMGAVTFDQKKLNKLIDVEDTIIVQTKMDGMYGNLFKDFNDNKFQLISRSGKPIYLTQEWLDKFAPLVKNNIKFNFCGELIIEGYNRYTSNGLLSRISKYSEKLFLDKFKKNEKEKILKEIEDLAQCSYEEVINKIKYYVWDILYWNKDSNNLMDPYSKRLKIIETIVNNYSEIVPMVLVNTKYIDCTNETVAHKEIEDFYIENISRGEEGVIIKSSSKPFKNGKPVYQIKMKSEFDCDLKIIGFEPGTPGTKYEKTLGTLICQDKSGQLIVKVPGIDEFWRDEIWNNKEEYLNKIVKVMHNGITKAKDKDTYSLMHPRFMEIREDKNEADDIDDLKKNE